eukprot:gene27692-7334_t
MAKQNTILLLLLGLLVVSAPYVRADEYEDDYDEDVPEGAEPADPTEKDVVVLTDANFEGIISKSKYALVEFYAPWCGHCKSLKPEYAQAATEIKEVDDSIIIAKVDVTENKPLGEKFEIKGFPTLKWFVNGKMVSDYGGGRDVAGIKSWVLGKTGPPTVTISTKEELAKKESAASVVVVAYMAAEGDAYETFKSVGTGSEGVTFVDTTDAALAKTLGLTKTGSIAVIRAFKGAEREVATFDGPITEESLISFITAERVPLTLEFNQDNSEIIFKSGIDQQIILWGSTKNVGPTTAAYKGFAAAAKALRGKLMFVTSTSGSKDSEPIAKFFGLDESNDPTVVGIFLEKQKKFSLEGELTADAILEFATSMADGTAQPKYKSAAIPEKPKDGAVTVIVGKTFESIVLDPKKDVILEVYAPWCGHCKSLEPIYQDLAKTFEKVDSVVIAKMDGTENEHAKVAAKGFPTILFYPARADADAEPMKFEGERTVEGFAKFLKENSGVKFEMPKMASAAAAEEEEDLDEYEEDDTDEPSADKDEL